MKLGEIVVHTWITTTSTSFIKIKLKTKVLLIEFQSVSRIVKIVHSEWAFKNGKIF